MYRTENKIIRLEAAAYIRDYRDAGRFIEYCKACGNYGTVWVCPPYTFDPAERIGPYKYVHLIGTQLRLDEITRHTPSGPGEQKDLSCRIMEEGRKGLDGRLLALEEQYPESRAFFAGSCFLCRKEDCTRHTGQPCRHPGKARSSLEAYGFDISRTASELLGIELKWSRDLVLPEYFTLVSGLFTNHEIEMPEWK